MISMIFAAAIATQAQPAPQCDTHGNCTVDSVRIQMASCRGNPGAAADQFLAQAREAIDLGDLDQADRLLERAGKSARLAAECARAEEAGITDVQNILHAVVTPKP